MTSVLAGWLVGLSGSRLAMILVGMTITMAGVLLGLHFTRRSRASVRHLLLVSSFAMLGVLPIASVLIPSIAIAVPVTSSTDPMPDVATSFVAPGAGAAALVGDSADAAPLARQRAAISLAGVVTVLWAIGVLTCLAPVVVGLAAMRSLRRSATACAVAGADVLLHQSVSGPVTFGVLRPVIVMPADAETWSSADLMRAVIHEREHVRRWDWLSQCLARVLCAVYWFHPLVWVARRRLDLEAERACDDAVLKHESWIDDVSDPTAYADQLVVLARRLSSAHPPLLAMANRADLSARVRALLDARQRRGRAGTLAVVAVMSATALMVAMMSSFKLVAAPQSISDVQAPAFEVASIKPCAPGDASAPAGGRGAGGPAATSPGRLNIPCSTVITLINRAYVTFGNPPPLNHPNVPDTDIIQGGPAWAHSDKYAIEAKAEGTPDTTTLNGPMLRNLLAERFQLKIHEDVKDVPVLALTVASGGLRLQPVNPATCIEPTPNNSGPRVMRPSPAGTPLIFDANGAADAKPFCVGGVGRKGPNVTYDVTGQRFDQVAKTLSSLLVERPVVDKTGVVGQFSFHVEFAADDNLRPTPFFQNTTPNDPGGPSIFAAFEKDLGLKLVPTKGPQGSLVIDRLERPSEKIPQPQRRQS